jgi:hypothetical protein
MLHPMWEPVTRGNPDEAAFLARCLLGPGVVGASRRLSMLDLRVWAALCAMLRDQLLAAPEDDLTLDRASSRTVATTGYQLAERVSADDGGEAYRLLRTSLVRLADVRACVRVVERDRDVAVQLVREGYVPLVGEIWLATTRLDLRMPSEWGGLKATTSLKVEIGQWAAQQVCANSCTWLDLDLLRALGAGLPARLWVALEAWARWPQRSFDGHEETAIGLGEPAMQSLGVGGYSRARRARQALEQAGARIAAIDPAYDLVCCERRAGWCLVARRVSGARARAQARSGATWRSPGIAASKRQRQAVRTERQVVREIVRQKFDTTSDHEPAGSLRHSP